MSVFYSFLPFFVFFLTFINFFGENIFVVQKLSLPLPPEIENRTTELYFSPDL